MQLRDYQDRTVDEAFAWLGSNQGHPCIELPTGSGKTLTLSEICKRAIQSFPHTRVLVLSHVKELLEQAERTMVAHWPGAPCGVYSAGLNRRQFGRQITIAGIQSLRNKFHLLGKINLVIVDEAHMISHKDQGLYRELFDYLLNENPSMRVIGLTATPYRLGHGLITDDPAIFTEILRPTSIEELILKGYLAPLRSKFTSASYDMTGVHKRGGDYIESEVAAAVDTEDQNTDVCREIVERAGDRRAWLVFCASVSHAEHMRDIFMGLGVLTAIITGETPKAERDRTLKAYKAGEIKCITNVGVLTTGFDYPGIDLVALCRPTLSPGLYAQMVGRGLRLKPHTDHCMVLDFAGLVSTHGPITAINTPYKARSGKGEATIKLCDKCHEICPASARVCPGCGAEFEKTEAAPLHLRDDDVMEIEVQTVELSGWNWSPHTSRNSGMEMIKVEYFPADMMHDTVREYLCLRHTGYARAKAEKELFEFERRTGLELNPEFSLESLCEDLNTAQHPESITTKPDGQFVKVIDRTWGEPRINTPSDPLEDDIPF